MTYEEVVETIRGIYENADARTIFEHIAVQINIVGEGEGILYMEVANRQICVEPYDYYDRDGLMTVSADTVSKIAKKEISFREAVAAGLIHLEGNMDKFRQLEKIVIK